MDQAAGGSSLQAGQKSSALRVCRAHQQRAVLAGRRGSTVWPPSTSGLRGTARRGGLSSTAAAPAPELPGRFPGIARQQLLARTRPSCTNSLPPGPLAPIGSLQRCGGPGEVPDDMNHVVEEHHPHACSQAHPTCHQQRGSLRLIIEGDGVGGPVQAVINVCCCGAARLCICRQWAGRHHQTGSSVTVLVLQQTGSSSGLEGRPLTPSCMAKT